MACTGPTITVGYDWSRSTTKGVNYTNAQLNAGGDLIVSTGRDAAFMGVNANGRNVYLDVGRDFSLLSLQDWSKSDSRSFNASVSFTINANGVPVPTGFSLGGGFGVGRRIYIVTPTTLIAGREITENGVTRLDGGTVDIYVGRATLLGGSGIWSRSNDPAKLKLDTGVLAFDNFNDVDYARQISGNASFNFATGPLPTVSFSNYYKNVQGLTFATVGAGTITTRNGFQDLALLNRDPANMQQVLKRELIDFKLSGVNLNEVVKGVQSAATIFTAYTAGIPDSIRASSTGVSTYRRLMLEGLTEEQARSVVGSELFQNLARAQQTINDMRASGREPDKFDLLLLNQGYTILLGQASQFAGGSVLVDCGSFGTKCEVALDSFKNALRSNVNYTASVVATMLGEVSDGISAMRRGEIVNSRTFLEVSNAFKTLLQCSLTEPAVFRQFVNDPALAANIAFLAQQRGTSLSLLKAFAEASAQAERGPDGLLTNAARLQLLDTMRVLGLAGVIPEGPMRLDPRKDPQALGHPDVDLAKFALDVATVWPAGRVVVRGGAELVAGLFTRGTAYSGELILADGASLMGTRLANINVSALTNAEKSVISEAMAKDMILANPAFSQVMKLGYRGDNGLDLVARTVTGEFVYFEVKSTTSTSIGNITLSYAQQNSQNFVVTRLERAATIISDEASRAFAESARDYAKNRITAGQSLNTQFITFDLRNRIVGTGKW